MQACKALQVLPKVTLYSPVGPSHWMVFLTQSIMPAAGQILGEQVAAHAACPAQVHGQV